MKKILNWFIDELCRTWPFLIYLLIVAMVAILIFMTIPVPTQIAFLEQPISELTVQEVFAIIVWGYVVVGIIKLAKL